MGMLPCSDGGARPLATLEHSLGRPVCVLFEATFALPLGHRCVNRGGDRQAVTLSVIHIFVNT